MVNLPILVLHVGAGACGLVSGGTALALRKGGTGHKRAGTVFFASMLLMSAAGAALAIVKPDRITAMSGVFTFYLVLTAWATARGSGRAGRFELYAFVGALATATIFLFLGVAASRTSDGRIDRLPGAVADAYVVVAALAACLDLNFISRRRVSGRQRIARHAWRMCLALSIAAMAFFLGQQKVMPAPVQGSPLLSVPPLAALGAIIYWVVRLRLTRRGARRVPAAAAMAEAGA